MWGYYQPAIIKYTLIPYILYMLTFMHLVTYVSGDLLDGTNTHAEEHNYKLFFLLIASLVSWLHFLRMELKSLIQRPHDYISDPWNIVDLIGVVL